MTHSIFRLLLPTQDILNQVFKMILKKSCFCYSLRHGAVVIGISVVVSSAVSLLALIGMIAEWKDIRESFKDERMRERKKNCNLKTA